MFDKTVGIDFGDLSPIRSNAGVGDSNIETPRDFRYRLGYGDGISG